MRWFYIFALMLLALSFHGTARADILPGDSCTGFPIGAVTRAGGPEVGGGIGYMMACTAEGWAVVYDNGVVPSGGGGGGLDYPDCVLNPGTDCGDGTVLSGIMMSPTEDESEMPEHAYLTFISTTDDSTGITWNDGSTNHAYVGQALEDNCPVGVNDDPTCAWGKVYTDLLYSKGTSPSPAPYRAARLCRDKGANWFLPSYMDFLYASLMMGDIVSDMFSEPDTAYWLSTELSLMYGISMPPYNGIALNITTDSAGVPTLNMAQKETTARVKCMRYQEIPPADMLALAGAWGLLGDP